MFESPLAYVCVSEVKRAVAGVPEAPRTYRLSFSQTSSSVIPYPPPTQILKKILATLDDACWTLDATTRVAGARLKKGI